MAAPALGAATGDGYRLAGIMTVGSEHIGFLELPQGGQVLVCHGSTINGGRVVEFSDRVLRIAFPDGVVELVIDGSGSGPAQLSSNAIVLAQHRAGEVAVVRQVAVEPLVEALSHEAARSPAGSGKAARRGVPDSSGVADGLLHRSNITRQCRDYLQVRDAASRHGLCH